MARGPGGDLRLRLLLDEHLSPEITRRLRARGHDAIAVRDEEGLIGQPDRLQFAWAGERRRTIVTRDLGDFRPLLAEAIRRGAPAYGLICVPRRFRLTRRAIGQLVKALDALLDSHPEDDAIVRRYGGEYWLPVAVLAPLPADRIERLLAAGDVAPAKPLEGALRRYPVTGERSASQAIEDDRAER